MFALRFHRFGRTLRAGAAALIAAATLGLTSYAAQASLLDFTKFNVASRSMEPTLLLRDYVIAFPLGTPARGDLVAYRLPRMRRPSTSSASPGCPATRCR